MCLHSDGKLRYVVKGKNKCDLPSLEKKDIYWQENGETESLVDDVIFFKNHCA